MIIWAKVQSRFEALHNYSTAPQEVSFLRFVHRHEFHVTLWVEQFHDDRDVEYILCKRWLTDELRTSYERENMGQTSCEMIARSLAQSAQKQFPTHTGIAGMKRRIRVEVTEDGENGALVEL